MMSAHEPTTTTTTLSNEHADEPAKRARDSMQQQHSDRVSWASSSNETEGTITTTTSDGGGGTSGRGSGSGGAQEEETHEIFGGVGTAKTRRTKRKAPRPPLPPTLVNHEQQVSAAAARIDSSTTSFESTTTTATTATIDSYDQHQHQHQQRQLSLAESRRASSNPVMKIKIRNKLLHAGGANYAAAATNDDGDDDDDEGDYSHSSTSDHNYKGATGPGNVAGTTNSTTNSHNHKKHLQQQQQQRQRQKILSNNKQHMQHYNSTRHLLFLILFIIGLIVCVSSILCLLLLPSFVTQQIAKKLVLKNNSMLLERWSKPNVPMYFKVWLYDIKNAHEIVSGKRGEVKPRVEEIGPFVFNLKRQKDVLSFAGDNLYYTERKVYHFNRELSCCAINTSVTIPNIPLVAVVDRALSYNLPLVGRFIPRLINRAIQSLREQLFVRKQVREILFDGYDVELLRMVSRVGSLVGLPQQSQRFALLKGRNDTWRPEQDGVWAINTGQRDRKQFGRVSSWNSYKKLPFWAAPQCNVINGSDGTLFPPPIKRTEPLYIFNQELCRTVNLVFDRPSDVRSIKSLRFVLNPMNFAHTMTSSSSGGGGTGAQQSTSAGGASAVLQRQLQRMQPQPQQLAPANQTRTRINPLFQNRERGSLLSAVTPAARPPTLDSAGARADPISILGLQVNGLQPPVNPPPPGPPARAVGSPPAGQNSGPISIRRSGGGGGGNDALRPSASETRSVRGPQSPQVVAQVPPVAPVASLHDESGGAAAQQLEVASALAAAAKANADAIIRREQEKLIEAAQEAQLANERKSHLNPQTCFCDRKQTSINGVSVCEMDGLIDLSKCSKQAQVIFGSMPHFYNSDPRLLRQVVGLAPNASKHTTYLDIEPNTGLVLGGKRRVQLNVIIKHNNEIDGFENINDMLVPIVWFEESAMIPEETAQKFRSMYVDRIKMVNYILFSLLVASIALLIVDARLLLASRYWRKFEWRLNNARQNQHKNHTYNTPTGGLSQLVGQQQKQNSQKLAASAMKEHANGKQTIAASNAHSLDHSTSKILSPLENLKRHQLSVSGGSSTNSPLLRNSRSSLLSGCTPDSLSPCVSPAATPEGSPELRKWSLAHADNSGGGGGSGSGGSEQVLSNQASTTRIYLDGRTGGAGANHQLQQQQQQQVASSSNNNRSIIQLGAVAAHSSPEVGSIDVDASARATDTRHSH